MNSRIFKANTLERLYARSSFIGFTQQVDTTVDGSSIRLESLKHVERITDFT